MRVLFVGAHPDDEFLCSGTLAKYARRGDSVTICYTTDGRQGSNRLSPEETAAVRKGEAEAAAAVIGADLIWLGFPDEELHNTPDTRTAVVDAIRQAKPDVLLTHAPGDMHVDHYVTNQLVHDASGVSFVPNLKTKYPPHPGYLPIIHVETPCGLRFAPTEFVDITRTFDTKIEMLRKHASQLEMMKERSGLDLIENVQLRARYRGGQCQVRYAEAFETHVCDFRARPYRLLP